MRTCFLTLQVYLNKFCFFSIKLINKSFDWIEVNNKRLEKLVFPFRHDLRREEKKV